jgi:saccharopine dehydrogenase-like NADP-dependent oxidoreductase
MKSILVLGAGRSSACLIDYLIKNAVQNDWTVVVGDLSETAAMDRIKGSASGQFVSFDINNDKQSYDTIRFADVVISLLPAHLHPKVAKHCLAAGKHLLTASYVSDEMIAFHEQAASKGLLFLNECGLDPGIDHMSAMQIIDRIRQAGGKIVSFESFTGGLIAPETDPGNPWRYKFTWNPRNVVMAGQGTAKFLQDGNLKYIPYQQLFKRTTPVTVPGYGNYEGYANRDSLKYINTYRLSNIKTMLRGTLRNEGYCSAWDILVQLGCCDDSYTLEKITAMSHKDFINCFLDEKSEVNVKDKLCAAFGLHASAPEIQKLEWSGFFTDEPVGIREGTPAQIVEHILNKKWQLRETDKDMIVMWHRFVYEIKGEKSQIQASLVARGENSVRTAMAKTVGLPLAISAKLLLQGKIDARGVAIPIHPEMYGPVLAELKSEGIELSEQELHST